MAIPLLAEFCGNKVEGWSAPTVPSVTYHMSLHLLMHPWETRWGD